jgi:hypothetical protein
MIMNIKIKIKNHKNAISVLKHINIDYHYNNMQENVIIQIIKSKNWIIW